MTRIRRPFRPLPFTTWLPFPRLSPPPLWPCSCTSEDSLISNFRSQPFFRNFPATTFAGPRSQFACCSHTAPGCPPTNASSSGRIPGMICCAPPLARPCRMIPAVTPSTAISALSSSAKSFPESPMSHSTFFASVKFSAPSARHTRPFGRPRPGEPPSLPRKMTANSANASFRAKFKTKTPA